MLTHAVTGQQREAKPAGSYGAAPATTAHPNAAHQVKPCPAGVPAVAPAARPPLQAVNCWLCGWPVRLVVKVPEPEGVCNHATCVLCARWLSGFSK